jgi:phospholipid/cholesterol/gamma-HCH transport system permease protein
VSLTATIVDERLDLAVTGAWTAERATELEKIVDDTEHRYDTARSLDIDLARLERLDTFGAWLIERLNRAFTARGTTTRIVGLTDSDRGLFEEVRLVNRHPASKSRERNLTLAALESVGRAVAEIGTSFIQLAQMLGALTVAALVTVAHPSRMRWTSMVHHLERVGWRAVPIVMLSTFLIGAILAQQGIFHFRTFGAEVYVVDMVGLLVLREVGVLIVCVLVAGRSGSAYTAELGSMKMREEIDALRTMGVDPVEVLVLYGGMPPEIFLARLREAISHTTFAVGMIKAPFMALVIGLVACVQGFEVEGSAASLGLKTTLSVVQSLFLVIMLDGFFAIFFAAIGM